METIANFMLLEIFSLGTSKRRWSYSQAMGLPAASTMVDTAGTVPSTSSAETLSTVSAARLDANPNPPATGNITPATRTPANAELPASFATVFAIDTIYRVRVPTHWNRFQCFGGVQNLLNTRFVLPYQKMLPSVLR